MNEYSKKIYIHHVDKEINRIITSGGEGQSSFIRHFSNSQEFFLELEKEITVPQFPVHHDIRVPKPEKDYIRKIKEVIIQLKDQIPGLFQELIYVFDPEEIHKLKFLKLYKVEQASYLYMLTIDLLYRPQYHEVETRGFSDITSSYRTNNLFLEACFVPVEKVIGSNGKIESFEVKQTVSSTWIGETGRGYFVQGIWMDNDLTKFFSKLFEPRGTKLYPFYPFLCKYKTVCLNMILFSPEGRRRELPYLHRALGFLEPRMEKIQEALAGTTFSEEIPLFAEMKQEVPDFWQNIWSGFKAEVYLNKNEMREFKIAI